MATLKELKAAIYAANSACREASDSRILAENAYAAAIAEVLGLKIGSIVSTTNNQGYGANKKQVTRRYRVSEIKYRNYETNNLELSGYTIRKDGTEGERHEIWGDWTLEPEPPRPRTGAPRDM